MKKKKSIQDFYTMKEKGVRGSKIERVKGIV